MDMPFITHIIGECTDGSGLVQWCLLQSEARYKGSQAKVAWSQVAQTYVWPRATYHQCVCAEGKGQESVTRQEMIPRDIRKELCSFPKTIHIPCGQGPSGQSLVMGGGMAMYSIKPTAWCILKALRSTQGGESLIWSCPKTFRDGPMFA